MPLIYRGPRSSEFEELLKEHGIDCRVAPRWRTHGVGVASESELWVADPKKYQKAGEAIREVLNAERESRELELQERFPCEICGSKRTVRVAKPRRHKILEVLTLGLFWLVRSFGHWRLCKDCGEKWRVENEL